MSRRWWALIVISVSQLMITVDSTIVNVALPSVQRSLGMSDASRQWVLTAYLIAFGGLLLLGGRVADLVGRKRLLLLSVLGFAAASALGGTAGSAPVLIAARALQGACAALMAPAALALLAGAFPDIRERSTAMSVFSAITGSGAAGGMIAGGALTQYLSWRWSLLINTPIGLVVAVGTVLAVSGVGTGTGTGTGSRAERRRLDIAGAATVTLALMALIFGFSQAETAGWTGPSTLALLAVSVLLATVFVHVERKAAEPLLPLSVVASRARVAACLSQGLTVMAMFGLLLFLTYDLQTVAGYSAFRTGIAFTPLVGGMLIGAWLAGGRLPNVPPGTLMVWGCLIAAAGTAILCGLRPDSPYFLVILPASVVFGAGRAIAYTPSMSLATHEIDPRDTGVASGLINASQQVGGAIGTALLNTIAATATASWIRTHPGGPGQVTTGTVHGYAVGAAWAAGLLLLAALIVFALGRRARPARPRRRRRARAESLPVRGHSPD
jgi:EmrB/QacA subfamily drug resistance transporter